MPIAGGVYTRTDGVRTGATVNVTAAGAGVKCTAALADARENDIAAAINTCWFRDGSNAATGNMDAGAFRITHVAAGVDSTDAATVGQCVFPSGTAMLFAQTAAPTGWTKSTAHDNATLRVVSGTAGSGGTAEFSAVFTSKTPGGSIGSHVLTQAETPSHAHSGNTGNISQPHTHSGITGNPSAAHTHPLPLAGVTTVTPGVGSGVYIQGSGTNTGTESANHTHPFTTGNDSVDHTHSFTTSVIGSDGGHSHTWTGTAMDFAIKYVDVIIAIKD